MSKYMRHQAVISRNSDAPAGEDNWLSKMYQNLEKDAVQPRSVDQSLFHQINTIMNGKSKYPSVEAAVEDMMNRSGLTAYLAKENLNKVSEEELNGEHKKVASDQNDLKGMPSVIQKCPQIKNTLNNYIKDTKGNLPISAILEKIKSIHKNDVSEAKDWEDINLLKLISRENLKAKQDNPTNFETYNNLGKSDPAGADDLDPSNTDAFHALNPAK
jgi:hypothetical protein